MSTGTNNSSQYATVNTFPEKNVIASEITLSNTEYVNKKKNTQEKKAYTLRMVFI